MDPANQRDGDASGAGDDASGAGDDVEGIEALARLLSARRAVALTGAGCSTESGIPDYRGPLPDGRARPARTPIDYREFIGSAAARRRYWARAVLGWTAVARARPNPAHRALAALEQSGALAGVITQNVDGLHAAAGSRRVIELHGALARVVCLGCGTLGSRAALQERLLAQNPGWAARAGGAALAPDGDAELGGEAVARFAVGACGACGGVLKPDVVFFGETVPRVVVDAAWALLAEAEVLLVVGSSLTVYSGYRFVRRAAEQRTPVAIVNQGPTRGDDHAAIKVEARAGRVLPALARRLAQVA